MHIEDDSDVKIFKADFDSEGADKSRKQEERFAVEFERQRKAGNIRKAKMLGRMLADELSAAGSLSRFGFSCFPEVPAENNDMSFQRRVLMAFCAEVGLDLYIPNSVVASAAISEFYRRMENEYPDFYKSIKDSGAFSLYYLGLRTEDKVEKAAGAVFSNLCGYDGSRLYADLGEALFIFFMDTVEKMSAELGFGELQRFDEEGWHSVKERGTIVQ